MKRRTIRKKAAIALALSISLLAAGCTGGTGGGGTGGDGKEKSEEMFTLTTKVKTVIEDEAFGDYARLIFPVDRSISDDLELADADELLPWYHNVNPDRTVEIVNDLKTRALAGEQIFYDIYTEEEKAQSPDKRNTGLFFFRGEPGARTAIVNAGGGFVYVAAVHDSFPHALELSRRGYNAFALIYRPGAQTACEDLARAIAFIHEHASELQIDVSGYSLWGGSAGARMAAWLGSYGTDYFGEKSYPAPGAVIMQYTGLSQVTGNEPPTYACVGTDDTIAYYENVESYIGQIKENGTEAEIEVFEGLQHGFGLGEKTAAEGWLDHAVSFWRKAVGMADKDYENGILSIDEIREGTSNATVATPDDFPAEYGYGSGKISDWGRSDNLRKLPLPEGNETVLNTEPDTGKIQTLYLWEEGKAPARTKFTENMTGYFDDWDFRPYVTAIPVRDGVTPKGAVVLMAGGAYQIRGNYTDALPTAAALREHGYQTFIVDYKLRPYSQEEGALDVARAVRFIRKNAEAYGINPDAVAVMGFSAGGIQAGEFLMHYDEDVNGSALDASYVPDELDKLPARASAAGMIYSFYGRLSVGNMDTEWLSEGNLPPTFYIYGTKDPFYSQFERQYGVISGMGIKTARIVLDGWPHGFGADGGWVGDYADWLESIFNNL